MLQTKYRYIEGIGGERGKAEVMQFSFNFKKITN